MKRRQAGFTIIEMLIVVTILAMLAGVLVPILQEGQSTARDSRRMADLRSVQSALADYYHENGGYPNTSGEWFGDATDVGGKGYAADGYIPGLVPNFLTALPSDPDSQYPNATDGYMFKSDGTDYKFVLDATPEDEDSFAEGFPFYDPQRADGWMICTPGGYGW
ncbi:MAG: type II secretion system protein [Planctomycetes bacterium]|nr:type II secretion system protein [Planctomycetota bacterium]